MGVLGLQPFRGSPHLIADCGTDECARSNGGYLHLGFTGALSMW
jgi:hypothetical protein